MGFDRTGTEPISFDPDTIGTVKPTLAETDGEGLSPKELLDIFGIDANRFGKLPKRFVVPQLRGHHFVEQWYLTEGDLFLVEPVAWVPKVSLLDVLPASEFKTEFTFKHETIEESKFNAGASAELNIKAGGTYFGITASVKSSSHLSFEYSSSTLDEKKIETKGISGHVPISKLAVYPILRCKVVKLQRIEFKTNNSSTELEWNTNVPWGDRWVDDKRLSRVKNLMLHPVPMEGDGLGGKIYILPLPEVKEGGEVDVTTIISRQGWVDWYIYDGKWEDSNRYISLAVPYNDIGIKPLVTWAALVSKLSSLKLSGTESHMLTRFAVALAPEMNHRIITWQSCGISG